VPAVDRTGPGCVTRVTGMSDLVDRLVGALEPTRVRSGNALDSVPEMREVLGLFEGVAPGATGGGQNSSSSSANSVGS
jgi:hypothetical protein